MTTFKVDAFKQAVLNGFAPDGTLYIPEKLPLFDPADFKGMTLCEVATKMATILFPRFDMEAIVHESFTFPLPEVTIGPFSALELFHGPTLSFKDVGARFMAALTKRFDQKLTILVATTGDTGSAVGDAFHNQPNAKVYILYPKGGVTPTQEKQLTTIGDNVTALQIEGTFDDCQTLVKYACKNSEITTANSINVARLFPQAFYYFYACLNVSKRLVFSIPSGNFGHLVSGLLAKKMGAPIKRFIAATNCNDVVPRYLKTGIFSPEPTKHTIAVSMDVGNPSNFPRLLELFDGSLEKMQKEIEAHSYTDQQIRETMTRVYQTEGYLLDPHSAIAYLGLKDSCKADEKGFFFITAHPSKFESVIQEKIPMPKRLLKSLNKESHSITLTNDPEAFMDFLRELN